MTPSNLSRVNGHVSTIASCAQGLIQSTREPSDQVAIPIESCYGSTELQAIHHATVRADELVILVHGLGGSATSHYQASAAEALCRQGYAVLRLSQRGADRKGGELHHAGLWEDLTAVVEQWAIPRYRKVHLLGFSMGGHVALRAGCQPADGLASVIAICSPLHLEPAVEHVDRSALPVYRAYLLRGLRALYRSYIAARGLDVPRSAVRSLRRIRSFDEQVIVPHFGFRSTDDYYATESAGPRLDGLQVPALLVYTRHDPLVGLDSILPGSTTPTSVSRALARHGAEVRWFETGGHVAFPRQQPSSSPFEGPLYDILGRWLSER
jgi:uncharacterized protein